MTPISYRWFAALAVWTWAGCLPAQVGFSVDRQRIKSAAPPAVALRLADLDGDGLQDLVRLGERQLTTLLQDGAGRFRPSPGGEVTPANGSFFRDVAVSPGLDPSGPLPDVAVLGSNGEVQVLRNTAGDLGSTPIVVSPAFPAPACQLLVADLDGVAGDDLLVLLDGATLLMFLFLADGAGGFTEVSLSAVPDNTVLSLPDPHGALADFDGDGDPDLVVVSPASAPILLENDLNGNDGTGVLSPVPGSFPDTAPPATRVLAVDLVGGDDLPDVILGLAGPVTARPAVLPNLGGNFSSAGTLSDFATKGVRDLHAGDVNGDLVLDLVVLQDDGSVLLGTGLQNGGFATAEVLLPAAPRAALAIGDLEGDGDLDVCTAGVQFEDQLLWGNGAGGFLDSEAADFPLGIAPAGHLGALVDVDRNGDPDVVLYDRSGQPQWFHNVGSARFLPANPDVLPVLPGGTEYASLVAAAVTQPTRRELLVLAAQGAAQPLTVLVESAGQYVDQTALRLPVIGGSGVEAVAVGRVCLDGNVAPLDDLVFADGLGSLHLARNSGGFYSMVPGAFSGPPLSGPRKILLGDLDKDGNCDVVVLQATGVRVFHGSRFLVFTESTDPALPTFAARDGELADLDGDGDLDLVLVRSEPPSGLAVFTNDGSGTLEDSTALLDQQPRGLVQDVATVPAEPGLHLLAAADGVPDQLLPWTGAGYATPVDLPYRGSNRSTALLTGDADRDGDVDVVTLRAQTLPGLLRNTHRHFSHTGVTQIGRVLSLRFASPTPNTFAFLHLGPAIPATWTPFGLLRISPPAFLVRGFIPPGQRDLEMSWPLPANLTPAVPALQVAFVDSLLEIRLSNMEFVVLTDH